MQSLRLEEAGRCSEMLLPFTNAAALRKRLKHDLVRTPVERSKLKPFL